MKFYEDKKKIKVISIILVLLMVFIAVIPNYSIASSGEAEDKKEGGKLFNPVFRLFAAVGDLVVKGLQKIFVGEEDIRIENPRKIR